MSRGMKDLLWFSGTIIVTALVLFALFSLIGLMLKPTFDQIEDEGLEAVITDIWCGKDGCKEAE